jgi:hypothetical protein
LSCRSETIAGVNPNWKLHGLLAGVDSSKSDAKRYNWPGRSTRPGPSSDRKFTSGVHEKIQPLPHGEVCRHAAFASSISRSPTFGSVCCIGSQPTSYRDDQPN